VGDASLTLIYIAAFPEMAGVPLIEIVVPVVPLRESPVGSVGPLTAHMYGGIPPEAVHWIGLIDTPTSPNNEFAGPQVAERPGVPILVDPENEAVAVTCMLSATVKV